MHELLQIASNPKTYYHLKYGAIWNGHDLGLELLEPDLGQGESVFVAFGVIAHLLGSTVEPNVGFRV